MKRLSYFLIFMLFFLSACASAPQVTILDSSGRLMPDPIYKLTDTQKRVFASFWFTAYQEFEDIDGSKVLIPTFLDMTKTNTIDLRMVKKLTLNIEFHNPYGVKYTMNIKIDCIESGLQKSAGDFTTSQFKYRPYEFSLDLTPKTKCRYMIFVTSETGERMLMVGPFSYVVKEVM